MNLLKSVLLLFPAVAVTANSAFADGGFIQKLPKDGTWVKYNMEMKAEKGPMREMTGTMLLKCVGTVQENGEAYRWIEIEFNGEQNGMKQRTVMKALIREKDLLPNAKSGMTILRGWQQTLFGANKTDPKVLSEYERSNNGQVAFMIHTPLKNAKPVKQAKQIDYQKGRLKLETARVGDAEVKLGEDAPPDFKYSAKQTVWQHKSIPTGSAALKMEIEMRRKDEVVMKMTMKFSVQDYGKGAKSALPDKT